MWLESEVFANVVKEWWEEAHITGHASFVVASKLKVVASKLKVVKERLKKWIEMFLVTSRLKSMIFWVLSILWVLKKNHLDLVVLKSSKGKLPKMSGPGLL